MLILKLMFRQELPYLILLNLLRIIFTTSNKRSQKLIKLLIQEHTKQVALHLPTLRNINLPIPPLPIPMSILRQLHNNGGSSYLFGFWFVPVTIVVGTGLDVLVAFFEKLVAVGVEVGTVLEDVGGLVAEVAVLLHEGEFALV